MRIEDKFRNPMPSRMLLFAERADDGDAGGDAKQRIQKIGKAISAAGQAGADSEHDSYKEAMSAARAGVMKDAPKPDRYDVLATNIPSYKRGGKMKHRGVARLHRGEKAKGRSSKGR